MLLLESRTRSDGTHEDDTWHEVWPVEGDAVIEFFTTHAGHAKVAEDEVIGSIVTANCRLTRPPAEPGVAAKLETGID